MIGERVIGDYRDDLGTYICIAIIEQLEIWRICGKGAYTLSLVWNFRMQDLHFFQKCQRIRLGLGQMPKQTNMKTIMNCMENYN
jgi:hypothetical protein